MVRTGAAGAAAVMAMLAAGGPARAGAYDGSVIAEVGGAGLVADAAKAARTDVPLPWRIDSATAYGLGYAIPPAPRASFVLAAPGRKRDRYGAGFGRSAAVGAPALPDERAWYSGQPGAATLDGLSLKFTHPDNAIVRELPWAHRRGLRLSLTAQF
ncbi:MAG: hypothetical protein GC203_15085 [Phenylobacterium sp.]|uniref:hypothetical protein n=1 Tax=Phenylobacterium sp. TaxID=1871053 RepID=UPI0025D8D2E3|nr:hypothetical protein [Phenylobacterium sp.]MBI1199183.1 hypothetical protein [Phenylobacterium sp.]